MAEYAGKVPQPAPGLKDVGTTNTTLRKNSLKGQEERILGILLTT